MRHGLEIPAIQEPRSIVLAPGSHSSPREGVCVVELASILAGEEFSDRPRCVCPVIGAFLRGWNDRAAYADRQRLLPYAKRVVRSRGGRRLTRERREICLRWAEGADDRGWVGRRVRRLWVRARIGVYAGLRAALDLNEGAGEYAARVAFSRRDHEGAFELLDSLLGSAPKGPRATPERSLGRNGSSPMNGKRPPLLGIDALPAPNGNGASGPSRTPGSREHERV